MPEIIKPQVKKRKPIRKKIADFLKGKTDAGDRVFPNASIPAWESELPAILVYTRSESASEFSVAPRELERSMSLAIEIIAAGPEIDEDGNQPKDENGQAKEMVEDILDNIAEQIENLLAADDTFEGVCDRSILTNTEFEYEASGGQTIGSCRLTYNVVYYRMSPDAEPEHSNFKKVEADFRVGHDNSAPDNINETHDSVAIPQT